MIGEIERRAATRMSHDRTHVAMIYAAMGDVAKAVDSLEKAAQWREPDAVFMGVDPAYDRLRSDPKFNELRKRLRLP